MKILWLKKCLQITKEIYEWLLMYKADYIYWLSNKFCLINWMMLLHFCLIISILSHRHNVSFQITFKRSSWIKNLSRDLYSSLSSSHLIKKITLKVVISGNHYHSTLELSCPPGSMHLAFEFLTCSASEQDCLMKGSYRGTLLNKVAKVALTQQDWMFS